jgi:hypothetical protein
VGGGILFPTADIHIRPVYGTAIFVVYKGNDNRMDEGFSKYGSCPIETGERFMVKMKFREGIPVAVEEPSIDATPTLNEIDPHKLLMETELLSEL